MPTSLVNSYEKSLNEKWCMRFRTKHPDGEHYDGVVAHLTPTFIALIEVTDFEPDGVLIFPKRHIKSVRDGKYEQCENEILRLNRALNSLRQRRWLTNCETIPEVFIEMKRKKVWPAIETMPGDKDDGSFYIGPITEVNKDGLSILCYDAAGNWEGEYEIGFDEIYRIEFESRYCKHFNKYMKLKNDKLSSSKPVNSTDSP